jgi:VWFA-related protein
MNALGSMLSANSATARLVILLSCAVAGFATPCRAQSPPTKTTLPSAQPAAPNPDSAESPAPPETSPEMNTRNSQVPFESRVNLVPIRVVVHDAKGHAVANLNREDFQVFQDKKLQLVSHFSVVTPTSAEQHVVRGEPGDPDAAQPVAGATTAALALPSRFVAMLFDDAHLNLNDMVRARVAAIRYLDSSFEPNDRVAILTTSGQTQVDFTDDRAKIHAVLMQLLPRPVGTFDPSGMSQCPPMDYYEADLIQNKNDSQAIAVATQDAQACNGGNAAAAGNLAITTAYQVLMAGDLNTQYAIRRLEEIVRRLSALPGQRSIVLVSPGFLTPTQDYDLSVVIDKATRANVYINTLDARGLYTIDPLGDITQPVPISGSAASSGIRLSYTVEAQSRQSDVLAELSDSTGGFYFRNNNDLDTGFRITAAAPEVSYLLAFTPQGLKYDGQFHSLKVKLSTPEKYTIQARRGFFAPKHSQTPEDAAKEDIEEAVFSQEEQQGLPIELHLQYYKSDAINAKLSVLTHLDVAHVRFEKADGRNRDDVTIVAALFDRNGNFITGNEKTVELRLKDATLERLTQTGVTVKTSFDVKPGGYIVRLVVRDSKAAVLSAKNGVVEIP